MTLEAFGESDRCEVDNILEPDRQLGQHEIELQPVPLELAADDLVLA